MIDHRRKAAVVLIILAMIANSSLVGQDLVSNDGAAKTIESRILPPPGYVRPEYPSNNFATWLRNLPLKPDGTPIRQYDGSLKDQQSVGVAVIDISTGNKDLQQCADVVIRLRAEYLYSQRKLDKIAFDFSSGDRVAYSDWRKGRRPVVFGNKVSFRESGDSDTSYAGFHQYLNTIFTYAGSWSLANELIDKSDWSTIEPGDVIVEGGFPGHAVIVVDVVIKRSIGGRLFLLAQGFTPAQDAHILNNPDDRQISPWYATDFGRRLVTPQWAFGRDCLKSWP